MALQNKSSENGASKTENKNIKNSKLTFRRICLPLYSMALQNKSSENGASKTENKNIKKSKLTFESMLGIA